MNQVRRNRRDYSGTHRIGTSMGADHDASNEDRRSGTRKAGPFLARVRSVITRSGAPFGTVRAEAASCSIATSRSDAQDPFSKAQGSGKAPLAEAR